MAEKQCSPATTLAAGIVFMLGGGAPAVSADKPVESKTLADALVEVGGDEDTWFRSAGLLAFSLEMGIPEERFRETHPGAQLDKLPASVLAALRQHVGAINAWCGCLRDKRETQIVENDLFGGGSSKNAKKRTCEQIAAMIVVNLLPAKLLAGLGEDDARNYELMAKAAAEWEERVRGKPANERMKAWFDDANDTQHRMFLALVIQTGHAPAYRLLEADFAKRANAADVYLYLELSACFRHRRAAGQKLYQQILPVLRKQPFEGGPPGEQQFFLDMWKLLTDYDTLEAAIADWQAGRLKQDELAELLNRSIDQPWAYHSMGLEPVSVFRPTMEHNLKALVAAAAREQVLTKRLTLLELGLNATRLLNTIIGRSDEIERRPAPRSDAAEWRPMVQQLRELFKDDRVVFEGESLIRPGQKAAGIVWELWKPEEQRYDAKTRSYSRDWRTDTLNSLARTARSLKIPAAEYFLTQPDGVGQEAYPEQTAAAVAAKFVDGDAAAWRRQLVDLPWNERLMLELGYRLISDDRMEAFFPKADRNVAKEESWPDDDYPLEFPNSKIKLSAYDYDPIDLEDAYHWSGVFGIAKLSPRDQSAAKKRVAKLTKGLGLGVPKTEREFDNALCFPFMQGKETSPCLNPKCPNRNKEGSLIALALMPAEPVKGVRTFGQWGGGVQLIFRICPKCYTIRVSNQCD